MTRIIDPRIKIRHIVCFLEVVRLRSVNKTAEALGISQPAVSKTIQELEEFLGQKLFERVRRRLVPTEFGDVFCRYATTSIAALRQGVEAARTDEQRVSVRIGALPTVSTQILPDAIADFAAQNPHVQTSIITGPNDYLLAQLRAGDVDLVIGRMAEPDAMIGLTFEHLYSERVVIAVRPGHALLSAKNFNLSMIEPYQALVPTRKSVIYPLVSSLLMAHGITGLRGEIETVSSDFGRAYIRKSDAIWFISEGVVAQDVAESRLALLPVETSETLGPVGLTMRVDQAPIPAMVALMQTVRARASGQVGSPSKERLRDLSATDFL